MFNKSLIIGLGLIGGSFARSLKQKDLSKKIFACDKDEEALNFAIEDNVVDEKTSLDGDFSEFDLIVIATPLNSYKKIAEKLAHKINDKTLVIDLGSVKNLNLKLKNFVACHPIAGSQNSGFENSSDTLFEGKKFVICPDLSALDKIDQAKKLAEKIGAIVELLDSKKHDEIYALVSHLPQFLSFLTKDFSPKNITDNFFKNAFRLDESSPEMWGDIFNLNQKNLEGFYLEFFDNLEKNVNNPNALFKEGKTSFNEEFFINNFAAIFFRALVVASYLEIEKIKEFEPFCGQGFKDFTSIISIFSFDKNKLQNLLEKNRSKILSFVKEIS